MNLSRNRIIVIHFIMMLSFCVYSQEYTRALSAADESFSNYAYVDARRAYLDVANRGYVSEDLYKKLGDSYYFNSELEEANIWYEKLVSSYGEGLDPAYLFRYSQTLKSKEQYKEADKILLSYYSAIGGVDERSRSFVSTGDYLNFIEKQSGRFRLLKLGINTPYSDYAPSFDQRGGIVFASSRGGGSGLIKSIHEWNKMPFLDLYRSPMLQSNGILQRPSKLRGKINTKFHESSTVFTRDGNTVYFTRNNYTSHNLQASQQGTILLKLYKGRIDNGRWVDIKELPFNSDEYSVAHPALSPSEDVLYFSSDMPGTLGLSDLYSVNILGEDSYSDPVNLGALINTPGRESFPYVSKSGHLYFASDGHVGLGGLDVFVSVPEEAGGAFSRPYNVGKPINSPKDDFTFILDESSRIGYFATNRLGGKGNDDIYSFKQTSDLILDCQQYLKGFVTDARTRAVVPGADVYLLDGSNTELARMTTDDKGAYKFEVDCDSDYVLRATKSGYSPTEAPLLTNEVFEYTHKLPLQLQQGEAPLLAQPVKAGDDLAKLLHLEIIYFDLDKSFIRPDAAIELQKIISVLRSNPEIRIDVRSHTDSRSGDDYNMFLSERRARSTMKYLIEKGGIEASRISGRGYGETSLVNGCKNGVNCSEAEHQQNRRSEFIILQ